MSRNATSRVSRNVHAKESEYTPIQYNVQAGTEPRRLPHFCAV